MKSAYCGLRQESQVLIQHWEAQARKSKSSSATREFEAKPGFHKTNSKNGKREKK